MTEPKIKRWITIRDGQGYLHYEGTLIIHGVTDTHEIMTPLGNNIAEIADIAAKNGLQIINKDDGTTIQ